MADTRMSRAPGTDPMLGALSWPTAPGEGVKSSFATWRLTSHSRFRSKISSPSEISL